MLLLLLARTAIDLAARGFGVNMRKRDAMLEQTVGEESGEFRPSRRLRIEHPAHGPSRRYSARP